MPLVQSVLAQALEAAFKEPGATESQCAAQWADAMAAYALSIAPPSSTAAVARTAMLGALAGFGQADQAVAKLHAAFTAFAGSLAGGMPQAPTPSAPPPPLSTELSFLGSTLFASHHESASRIAAAIHTWMITGTSPIGPWS
jgi:hypothetical protein